MCVTKLLMALKLDQTNPDLYYSLAVYYMKQNETTRASKCLDKALALRPSFE
jgi:Tfp pilus assembly protein PilF